MGVILREGDRVLCDYEDDGAEKSKAGTVRGFSPVSGNPLVQFDGESSWSEVWFGDLTYIGPGA